MRNLKRVLSLALALVMMLGMMIITTSAAEAKDGFADADEITYTEAVDVMAALGVLKGDGTNFNPTDVLTREQGAKIVCAMLMGPDNADKLTGTTNFTDVPADRWSAGPIAYCVNLGILAGNGDGTFDPTGELTALAFGKMLLVALGYDAEIEGYVGKDWATNIGADMLEVGIDVKGVALTSVLTREQAAQMAFQTLTKTLVAYKNGIDVTTSDGTTVKVDSERYNVGVYGEAAIDSYTGVADTPYTQFCEKYFADLTVDNSDYDDFDRPAKTWTYDLTTVGTYAKTADKVYTSAARGATYAAKINSMGLKGYTVNASATESVNGNPAGGAIADLNEIVDFTGNGVLVEVWFSKTVAKEITDVVITNTTLAQISAKTASKITLTAKSGSAGLGGATLVVDSDNDNFEALSQLDKNTYVLAVAVTTDGTNYDLASFSIPETVTGKVTAVEKNSAGNNTSISIDDEKLSIAAVAGTDLTSASVSTTATSTIWLDEYGNAIYGKVAATSATNFLYVLEAYQTLDEGKIVNMAKGVKSDGSIVDVKIDDTGSAAADTTLFAVTSTAGGKYKLAATSAAGAASGATTAASNTVITLIDGDSFEDTDRTLTAASTGGGGTTNYYNNYLSKNIVFIYVDKTNKTAVVKTGAQDVTLTVDSSHKAYALVEDNSANDSTSVVTAVILEGNVSTSSSAAELLYVKSNATTGTVTVFNKDTGKNVAIPTYDAYKDGEKITVVTNSTLTNNTFYTYAVSDATGAYVMVSTAATAGTAAVAANNTISSTFDNRMVTLSGGATVDISEALIVDLRAPTAQSSAPITLSAEGLCDAKADTTTFTTISLSVIYDANTMIASHVYIVAHT